MLRIVNHNGQDLWGSFHHRFKVKRGLKSELAARTEPIGRAVAVATIGSVIPKRFLGKWQEADFCLFTMATETLNTDIRRLTVMIFILIKCNSLSCQQFIISFQTVSDCVVGHFYDVSSLSCVQCGEDQRASATGWSVSGANLRLMLIYIKYTYANTSARYFSLIYSVFCTWVVSVPVPIFLQDSHASAYLGTVFTNPTEHRLHVNVVLPKSRYVKCFIFFHFV